MSFFCQAEDGIRDSVASRGLGDVYKKQLYDELIPKTGQALGELAPAQRVVEIAFLLNARHGLLLARRFGGKVSVELHTALAPSLIHI